MRVIFIKDSAGAGKKGEIKEVSSGYAQNFLIPKGFAQVATPDIIKRVEKEGKEQEAKKQKEVARLTALKAELEKRTFTVKVKVGDKGQVFGGVHEKDVAASVNSKMDISLEKNQVEIPAVIKELGIYQVKLKLGSGIIANVKINIQAE